MTATIIPIRPPIDDNAPTPPMGAFRKVRVAMEILGWAVAVSLIANLVA